MSLSVHSYVVRKISGKGRCLVVDVGDVGLGSWSAQGGCQVWGIGEDVGLSRNLD